MEFIHTPVPLSQTITFLPLLSILLLFYEQQLRICLNKKNFIEKTE